MIWLIRSRKHYSASNGISFNGESMRATCCDTSDWPPLLSFFLTLCVIYFGLYQNLGSVIISSHITLASCLQHTACLLLLETPAVYHRA